MLGPLLAYHAGKRVEGNIGQFLIMNSGEKTLH